MKLETIIIYRDGEPVSINKSDLKSSDKTTAEPSPDELIKAAEIAAKKAAAIEAKKAAAIEAKKAKKAKKAKSKSDELVVTEDTEAGGMTETNKVTETGETGEAGEAGEE